MAGSAEALGGAAIGTFPRSSGGGLIALGKNGGPISIDLPQRKLYFTGSEEEIPAQKDNSGKGLGPRSKRGMRPGTPGWSPPAGTGAVFEGLILHKVKGER